MFSILSRNQRVINNYKKVVEEINKIENQFINLSNEEIKNYSNALKLEYKKNNNLNAIKVRAFALCREASKRTLGMRHFDVQLIGGLALNDNKIAEMRTGEGKTLVATLSAYLNALTGKSVHVITVNDYLAERDAKLMEPLFNLLNISVGYNISTLNTEQKKSVYENNIIYGTNSEFGFDYLKNQLVNNKSEKTQKDLGYAIIDEVDSILIDEARTPLIISENTDEDSNLFIEINNYVKNLKRELVENDGGHFSVDEEKKQIYITEVGYKRIENDLIEKKYIHTNADMYHDLGLKYLHHIQNAIKANYLFHNNQQYLNKDNKILIIDEFTGRIADGRRWSDGIHQAIEAKENVEIQKETKTLASITYQNYFLLYEKLSGMTGTAATEAVEFFEIYHLETLVIPTNKPISRIDHEDIIYGKLKDKYSAVIEEVKKSKNKGQPVLIGTSSIESSEIVSKLLNEHQIEHQLLNAKYHKEEAEIIAQAGKLNTITIATNMAGRGTDIILGGNPNILVNFIKNSPDIEEIHKEKMIANVLSEWKAENEKVILAGGLKVIGFERNESRRIDNQLRGRSGRQGDIGESIFLLSLEDDLFRIFGGDSFKTIISKFNIEDGSKIQNGLINSLLNKAQLKIENNNYNIRKNLIEFDRVLNEQRKLFYNQRNLILDEDKVFDYIYDILEFFTVDILKNSKIYNDMYDNDFFELKNNLSYYEIKNIEYKKYEEYSYEEIKDNIFNSITQYYNDKFTNIDKETKNQIEKSILLSKMDKYWQLHLTTMDKVKDFIHLRSFAQKDPKQEYIKEAYLNFNYSFEEIKIETASTLLKTSFVIHD